MLFKKLKLSLLITVAFLKREKKIVFFSSVAGIALFFLVIKVFPYLPRTKMTQKIGMVGNYNFNDLKQFLFYFFNIFYFRNFN